MSRSIAREALMAALALGFLVPASAGAEEHVPFVDGKMWGDSAPILKRTFLVGVANLMTAEYLYQKDTGPPPDHQTTIRRLYEEIDDVTLDQAIERIDAWYEKNPGKLNTTVLEVIWLDMVKPNLPPSRDYDD